MMIDAVVLAGGLGTRLKTVSGEVPKPLVDVGGIPFIYRVMKELERQGVSRIILAISYRSEFFKTMVIKDKPVQIPVLFSEEPVPLGTGGAIKKAMSLVQSERVLVVNGDSYAEIDYCKFISSSDGEDCSLSAIKVNDCGRYGALDIDKNHYLLKMQEKGREGEGLINAGVYLLKKDLFESFYSSSFSIENDFFPFYEGKIKVNIVDGYFIDIGMPEDYYKACKYFS